MFVGEHPPLPQQLKHSPLFQQWHPHSVKTPPTSTIIGHLTPWHGQTISQIWVDQISSFDTTSLCHIHNIVHNLFNSTQCTQWAIIYDTNYKSYFSWGLTDMFVNKKCCMGHVVIEWKVWKKHQKWYLPLRIQITMLDCHCAGRPFCSIPLLISSSGPTVSRSH